LTEKFDFDDKNGIEDLFLLVSGESLAGHATCPLDKVSPFTHNLHNSIDIDVLMRPWHFFPRTPIVYLITFEK